MLPLPTTALARSGTQRELELIAINPLVHGWEPQHGTVQTNPEGGLQCRQANCQK